MLKRFLFAAFCVLAIVLAGCSSSNNLLFGQVEATVGIHPVVVTDCYRISVPPPRMMQDQSAELLYRFTPCRDADVVIRGEALFVNGVSYGPLRPEDSVLVDHGVVSISGRKAAPANRN